MTLIAGFDTLEHLLEHIDFDRPVYALSINETVDARSGLSIHKTAIVVSQPQAGDLVNYVQIPTSRVEHFFGQPFMRDATERHEGPSTPGPPSSPSSTRKASRPFPQSSPCRRT